MIQRVKEIAIETGWSVSTDNDSGCTQFEFSKFTPAGQDFNFTVEMKDNNISQLTNNILEYYESFDPDYELEKMDTEKTVRLIALRTL